MCLVSEQGPLHSSKKSTVFPFVVRCFRAEVDRSPGGQQERTLRGNEVLRELRCHSETGSGSSLTLTGLRVERCDWDELESRGLAGL